MSDVIEIEGPVEGYRAEVAANQALRTIPGRVSADTTQALVSTVSASLLASREGRVTATIQNLDDTNPVHISLSTSAATTSDLRIDPGLMYTLPAAYEGDVQAIAVNSNVQVVAIEYHIDG